MYAAVLVSLVALLQLVSAQGASTNLKGAIGKIARDSNLQSWCRGYLASLAFVPTTTLTSSFGSKIKTASLTVLTDTFTPLDDTTTLTLPASTSTVPFTTSDTTTSTVTCSNQDATTITSTSVEFSYLVTITTTDYSPTVSVTTTSASPTDTSVRRHLPQLMVLSRLIFAPCDRQLRSFLQRRTPLPRRQLSLRPDRLESVP